MFLNIYKNKYVDSLVQKTVRASLPLAAVKRVCQKTLGILKPTSIKTTTLLMAAAILS